MTRDVLFVQGAGAGVHEEWDRALVESLRRELGPGYDVRYPAMPHEDDPALATWGPVVRRELASLRAGAVVVGHSTGGVIMLSVLADAAPSTTLGAIVLLAVPFMGKGGWFSDEVEPSATLAARVSAAVPLFLYHGEADEVVPVAHADLYARAIPHARVVRLAGHDHQFGNDLSEVAGDIRALGLSTARRG